MQHTTDALGRLVKVMELGTSADPRNLETDYTYDPLDSLTYVNQHGALGETPRTRSFTYDSLARLVTSTNPETGTICYGTWNGGSCQNGYDANGNLLYKTNANNLTTAYTYDALNRLLTKYAPDGDNTHYYYVYDQCVIGVPGYICGNAVGHLVNQGNPDGLGGTVFSYDAMGHVINTKWFQRSVYYWQNGMSAQYDLAGNPTTITYPDSRSLSQSYDSAGRLAGITDANSGTAYFSNAQYTAAGALTSATYGNGVTEYIQYNSRLQPCHAIANTPALPLVYYGGGGLLGNIYDRVSSYANSASASSPCGPEPGDNGNIAYIADWHNSGHTQSFTYDGLNRLTSAARSDGGYNHTYSYDSFGNLLIQDNINPGPTYSINSTNQLNRYANGNNAYTYDAAGNLVSSGTSDIGGHNFAYNSSSQIVSVDGGATATYLYNGLDERMEKDTPSGWTDYIYLNGQPMAELTSASLWTDYIYANGQKIARIADPYGAPTTVSYYLDDHLGTTQVELDASGNVTWQGQFTPFGSELPDGSTAMHYKFTGKERDAESGLDYFGARYYASTVGRWMSPDDGSDQNPFGPQSWSLYSYGRNNPLIGTDPDGHVYTICDQHGQCEKDISDRDFDQRKKDAKAAGEHWGGNKITLADGSSGGSYKQTDADLPGDPAANRAGANMIGNGGMAAIKEFVYQSAIGAATEGLLEGAGLVYEASPLATQLGRNILKGATGEAMANAILRMRGYRIVGSQVSVMTTAGRRVVDYIVEKGGEYIAIEVKTGGAFRDAGQLAKDASMESEGARIGKSGGELAGQTLKLRTIEMRPIP